MAIDFKEFMDIAHEAKALDIIECWDANTFNAYNEEFGPMTRTDAINMCHFVEAVSREELAAAEYFSKR